VAIATEKKQDKSIPTIVTELWAMIVAYFKQETIEPLKALGRFVAYGVAGAVCLAIGLTLWVIAVLRALQSETGSHLTRHLSWAPYFITLVAAVVTAGLIARRIGAVKRKAGGQR
jgi:uncharacterized membrane protein